MHGAGLGALPARDPPGNLAGQGGCPGAPGTYGSGYGANLSLTDLTHNWGAGRNIPSVETDCIGVVPTKFTPAEVDFKLGSFYRANHAKFSLDPGDHVEIVVNGAHIDVRVKYGATVTS